MIKIICQQGRTGYRELRPYETEQMISVNEEREFCIDYRDPINLAIKREYEAAKAKAGAMVSCPACGRQVYKINKEHLFCIKGKRKGSWCANEFRKLMKEYKKREAVHVA